MPLLQLAVAAETLLVRPVTPHRTGFEQVVFVASGLTSIAALALCLLAIVALVVLRRQSRAMESQLAALVAELRPLAQSASAAAADVRKVTEKVEAIVEDSRQTVASVNATVRATADLGRGVIDAFRGRRRDEAGDREAGDR